MINNNNNNRKKRVLNMYIFIQFFFMLFKVFLQQINDIHVLSCHSERQHWELNDQDPGAHHRRKPLWRITKKPQKRMPDLYARLPSEGRTKLVRRQKNTVWKYFWVLICGLLFEAIILVNKFSARQSDLSHHLHTHIFNVLLCIFLAKILHVHVALCGLICGMDNFGLICKGNENDYPEIR